MPTYSAGDCSVTDQLLFSNGDALPAFMALLGGSFSETAIHPYTKRVTLTGNKVLRVHTNSYSFVGEHEFQWKVKKADDTEFDESLTQTFKVRVRDMRGCTPDLQVGAVV